MQVIGLKQKIVYVDYLRYLHLQEKLRAKRRELVLLMEHPPTITAGIGCKEKNLLLDKQELEKRNIHLVYIKRGGDYTAHEPGQLVIYPHIDLKKRNIRISNFVEIFLVSIQTSIQKTWSLELFNDPSNPGLYTTIANKKLKVVSVGLYCKSFFTGFGASINISNSLHTFEYINPCGFPSSAIVSLQRLGYSPNLYDTFKKNFIDEFTSCMRKGFE
jgi:lipoyl(octanoyl) transferase